MEEQKVVYTAIPAAPTIIPIKLSEPYLNPEVSGNFSSNDDSAEKETNTDDSLCKIITCIFVVSILLILPFPFSRNQVDSSSQRNLDVLEDNQENKNFEAASSGDWAGFSRPYVSTSQWSAHGTGGPFCTRRAWNMNLEDGTIESSRHPGLVIGTSHEQSGFELVSDMSDRKLVFDDLHQLFEGKSVPLGGKFNGDANKQEFIVTKTHDETKSYGPWKYIESSVTFSSPEDDDGVLSKVNVLLQNDMLLMHGTDYHEDAGSLFVLSSPFSYLMEGSSINFVSLQSLNTPSLRGGWVVPDTEME